MICYFSLFDLQNEFLHKQLIIVNNKMTICYIFGDNIFGIFLIKTLKRYIFNFLRLQCSLTHHSFSVFKCYLSKLRWSSSLK